MLWVIYSDIIFGHIGRFPFLDLETYKQNITNDKLTMIVEIDQQLSFQTKLFIPKEK